MLTLIKKNSANVLTISSFFLGFSSILASIQAVNEISLHSIDKYKVGYADTKSFLAFAGLSIIFCTIFDFLDGFFARLFKVSGELGKQLDSLSDLISFGLAPGVLFFTITMIVTGHIEESGIFYRASEFIPEALVPNLVVLQLFAFIFPTCAMIRLAKFNLKPSNRNYFEGIASTYAGGMIALILSFNFYITPLGKLIDIFGWQAPELFLSGIVWFESLMQNYFFLFSIYMLLAFLMISKIKFIKLSRILGPFMNRRRFSFIIINALLLILLFKYYLLVIGILYLVLGNSIVQKKHVVFQSQD